jgi:hypothetical protein
VPNPVRDEIEKIAAFFSERVGEPQMQAPAVSLLTKDRVW